MKVRLTKLSESEYPLHPNNIPTGHEVVGFTEQHPKVGESFELDWWHTSVVQEIISENTFRTYNSIYKWEEI